MPIPSPEQLIDFEREHWTTSPGTKEELVRHELGIPLARHYQLLARAVGDERGIRHDPLWAARIRRRMSDRAAERGRRSSAA
ncbi:DUF3263 domain-containing protein [Microbacterium gilvum]|uniref:DUF3263 domain-containing protein n=1 Tax=Microbacterium gilvum TaxID=1336204 RepID=A0ABP8ZRC2_9MICO